MTDLRESHDPATAQPPLGDLSPTRRLGRACAREGCEAAPDTVRAETAKQPAVPGKTDETLGPPCSLNRELSALNDRLRGRVLDLERANADLISLLDSTEMLLLDSRRTVRHVTPALGRLMRLGEENLGQPFPDIVPCCADNTLAQDVREALTQRVPLTKQVTGDDGTVYLRRVLPYRAHDSDLGGVVITFTDVTEHARSEAELREANEQLESLLDARTQALASTAAALRATQQRFEFLAENVPELFAYLDTQQCYRFANRRHEAVLGRPRRELLGQRAEELLAPAAYARLRPHLEQALRGRETRCEIELPLAAGTRWLQVTLSPARDEHGQTSGTFLLAIDITDLKRVEAQVRASRDDVENLLGAAADGVVAVDEEGRIDAFNRSAEAVFGYHGFEVLGRHAKLLAVETYSAADHQVARWIEQALSAPSGEWRPFTGRRRDGSTFPAELFVTVVAGTRRLIGIVRDVTRRRQVEQELQHGRAALRALTRQLLHAQEHERRRVARELHDDVNQRLGMLAVELESLPSVADAALRERLAYVRLRVVQLSDVVHRLAYRLHEPLLDDLGLAVAAEQMVAELARLHGNATSFRSRGMRPYPPDVADCFYRILQECLANVAHHAPGAALSVRLLAGARGWRLAVRDFGPGFDLTDPRRRHSLGLVSIEERADAVGGRVVLRARPGWGTCVRVTVPARENPGLDS